MFKFFSGIFVLLVLLSFSVPCSAVQVTVNSSSEQNPDLSVENILDGDFKTRWSSAFEDNEWIEIDFGEIIKFDGMEIHWETAYASEYEILISEDNIKWKAVYSTASSDGDIDEINFPEASAQSIKIVAIRRATEWGNSIFEVIVTHKGKPAISVTNVKKKTALKEIGLTDDELKLLESYIIDDFEDADVNDFLGGQWQVVTDKLWCNGNSEAKMEFIAESNESKNSLKLNYTLGKRPEGSPFADFICKYPQEKDFYAGFFGIKFSLRGSGGKLRVIFISSNIEDWNYWGYIINETPGEWTEYILKWSDLKPGWGSTKPINESLTKISELQFHTENGTEGEKGWFEIDNVALIIDERSEENPLIDKEFKPYVDVNQAFYAPLAKKRAVVRCDSKLENGNFSVVDINNKAVLSGELKYWGGCWNEHFWILDFTEINKEGRYVIKVTFDDRRNGEASVFITAENIKASVKKTLEYFYTQRCGVEIPGWHKLCHTDDGVLPDGTHFDAAGGWHDCAGFDKEMYTNFLPVYFYTTIAFESDTKAWKKRMLEEARWGADWTMQMTNDTGYIWCHVEPHNFKPEDFIKVWADGTSTDNKVGTKDDRKITRNAWGPEEGVQAANMGALVKLGYLLRNEDREYSKKCIEKAKLIMHYLKNRDYYYRDKFFIGKGNSHYSLFHSGLLLADIYLYKLEKKEEYLEDARERIDFIINNCQTKQGEFLNSTIERVPVSGRNFDPYFGLICFYEFYKQFPEDPYVDRIKHSYQDFMEKQVMKRVGQTPYGQGQLVDSDLFHYIAVTTSQRNFAKPAGNSKTCQGKNCYWLSLATVCFYADEVLDTTKYTDIAINQIDWVVGKNPFGVSAVSEVGYRFPRMFTMWYWLDDHPAAEGVIPGGVINGIGGDKNDFPYLDLRNSNWMAWETNEYWNPPTAWFAFASWQYYKWATSKDLGKEPAKEISSKEEGIKKGKRRKRF
ncbi:MAG: glycoside hydrolase family 9 protein [Candidatus Auribacterota bacterium]|nr:glycoside hydrolase family 9 protein [Candidatus Auribacterota bacterium]